MFTNCHKLKQIKGIIKFNIVNVTNMNKMLEECNELEYLILSKFNPLNDNTNNNKGLISQLKEEKKKNIKLVNELNLEKKKNIQLLDNKEKTIAVIVSSIDQKINFPYLVIIQIFFQH